MFPLQLAVEAKPPEPTLEQIKKVKANLAAIAKRLTLDQLKELAEKFNKIPTKRNVES
jgi:hypothetical protein